MSLQENFMSLCLQFNNHQILIDNLWKEIEKRYSEKGRHYHNLIHLESMFSELKAVKDKILNFNTISFSVFYHDVIYDATSKLNEEKSAEFVRERLQRLGVNETLIAEITEATKSHQQSEKSDINYLLDADLFILGKDTQSYLAYTKQIRIEYSIYSDLLYKQGRKKVLQHFLELESIFKTEYFKEKYEVQARENIKVEISNL